MGHAREKLKINPVKNRTGGSQPLHNSLLQIMLLLNIREEKITMIMKKKGKKEKKRKKTIW